eukprot:Clim_evm78s109 gene=Clim_evmTU78s109
MVHRKELLEQMASAIKLVLPMHAPFLISGGTLGSSKKAHSVMMEGIRTSPVTVAMVATISQSKRLRTIDPDHFSHIIIDEAHHAVATTYVRVISHIRNAGLLGFTATPFRGDVNSQSVPKRPLLPLAQTENLIPESSGLEGVFRDMVFKYDIRAAVREGWLVKPQLLMLHCLNIEENVKVVQKTPTMNNKTSGDYQLAALSEFMIESTNILIVARGILEHLSDKQAVIFTVSKQHAHDLAQILTHQSGYLFSKTIATAVVDSDTPLGERQALVHKFRDKRLQFLINCNILTEGFDAPNVEAIAIARPTRSAVLYTQMVGRALRPSSCAVPHLTGTLGSDPATMLAEAERRRQALSSSAKPEALVVDFTGSTVRHTLVQSTELYDEDAMDFKEDPFYRDVVSDQVEVDGTRWDVQDIRFGVNDDKIAFDDLKLSRDRTRTKQRETCSFSDVEVQHFAAAEAHIDPNTVIGIQGLGDVDVAFAAVQVDAFDHTADGLDLPRSETGDSSISREEAKEKLQIREPILNRLGTFLAMERPSPTMGLLGAGQVGDEISVEQVRELERFGIEEQQVDGSATLARAVLGYLNSHPAPTVSDCTRIAKEFDIGLNSDVVKGIRTTLTSSQVKELLRYKRVGGGDVILEDAILHVVRSDLNLESTLEEHNFQSMSAQDILSRVSETKGLRLGGRDLPGSSIRKSAEGSLRAMQVKQLNPGKETFNGHPDGATVGQIDVLRRCGYTEDDLEIIARSLDKDPIHKITRRIVLRNKRFRFRGHRKVVTLKKIEDSLKDAAKKRIGDRARSSKLLRPDGPGGDERSAVEFMRAALDVGALAELSDCRSSTAREQRRALTVKFERQLTPDLLDQLSISRLICTLHALLRSHNAAISPLQSSAEIS